jgi:hypothetical protein
VARVANPLSSGAEAWLLCSLSQDSLLVYQVHRAPQCPGMYMGQVLPDPGFCIANPSLQVTCQRPAPKSPPKKPP